MEPFFSTGQHAVGFIAVGQTATGVFAFGQVATGFVAIGQVARGGIAIGMAAIGIVALGMASVGVVYAGGMIGVGGRAFLGFALELMPMPPRPHRPPNAARNLSELAASRRAGWLELEFALTPEGVVSMTHAGRPIPARLSANLSRAARNFASMRRRGLAYLVPEHPPEPGAEPMYRVTRIMQRPPRSRLRIISWLLIPIRLALLAALSYACWRFAILPVGDAVWP